MPIEIDDDAPLEETKTLLREYVAGLPVPIEIPDFEVELGALPGAYGRPRGRLFVARSRGNAVGCVALRPLGSHMGEVKRLYVREEFRGRGFARALVEAVIAAARDQRYTHLRLDTHESMSPARKLYES